MRRPAGVIVSAIVLALLSLFQILLSLGMALSAVVAQNKSLTHGTGAGMAIPPPAWMAAFSYGSCACFLLLAGWDIVTMIGMFRLRRWARYSILIIGGGLAAIGLLSALGLLAALAMPMPATPGMDATQAHSLQTAARVGVAVIAVLFAAMMAIGVWWLVYFNLKSVRAAFAGTTGDLAGNRRPLLVTVYAVFLIAGVIAFPFPVYMHLPAVLFTLILRGWASTAFYVCCAVLNVAVGIGLWRLNEWARRLALAVIAFGFVQSSFYLFRPTLIEQVAEETDRAMKLPAASPSYLQGPMHIFMFCISLLFTAAIAYMLYYYRGRFAAQAGETPNLSSPPA